MKFIDIKQNTKNREKIEFIAHHNGIELALDKLAEECAEYVAARIKDNIGEGKPSQYVFELADVLIMVEQVRLLIKESRPGLAVILQQEIERKLNRQIKRIEEEQDEVN